jgi:acyl-ACP thioesterase
MIFSQHIEIPSYLCDINDCLHTWAAVRVCQEVTEHHGNSTGIGFYKLLERNHAWVITRSLYNIYRLPNAFEAIDLSTWSRGNNGLIAMRDYRMNAADGELLLTGTSYWAMIDMTSRRVVRLTDEIVGYENHDILATEHASLDKIKLPADMASDAPSLQTPATFAMLDHTRHVNNSEYIKLIFDVLHDKGFDTQRPFTLELNFNLESRLGEQLTIHHRILDGVHYLQITNPRSLSVTARVSLL